MKVLVPAAIIALVFIGKRRVALEIFCYSMLTVIVIILLKILIGEGRPYVDGLSIIRYSLETDFGMPSGHAIMSVVVFGWLWFRHPRTVLFRIGSISLIFLIGLSRIYLGAHYPSQVVAGWMFGLLLLIVFRIIDSKLWSPFQKKLR
jgi:membrane-associated phospholipid phosphatase